MMSSNKRGNIFDQGRPENPYGERDESVEAPQKATAAQLATRKIKSAKLRRPAGASSGISQTANFGASPQQDFGFGSNNSNSNSSGGFSFGASNSGVTNSFPPAQSAAPSSTFTSSSFPAFGGNNSFNPQPPSASFNFSAGANNPFASSNSPSTMNGTGSTPAFGGFGSQSQSQSQNNPFGGLSQSNSGASSSPGLFGTTSSAPQPSMFGTTGSSATNPATTTTTAPASQPFTFGGISSSAQGSASTPAPSNVFGGLGASTPAKESTQNNMFGGFGANTTSQDKGTVEAATPKANPFGFGNSTPATQNAVTTAPTSSGFTFGSTAPSNSQTSAPPPANNLFAPKSSSEAPSATPAAAPSNPFGKLPSATNTASPIFNFTPKAQTSEAQSNASSGPSQPFGGMSQPANSSNSNATASSKPPLFASLSQPKANPVASPAAPSLGASLFDKPKALDTAFGGANNASETPASKPTFSGFSTPQPSKPANTERSTTGLFSAAQPKTSSGMFSQTFQAEKPASGNLFKPQSTLPPSTSQSTSAKEAPKTSSNAFSKPDASAFASSTQQAASTAPSMPNLTGNVNSSLNTPKAPELPKLGTIHVPKEWNTSHEIDDLAKTVAEFMAQLQDLNTRYREQLNNLPPLADWSKVSLWHHQRSIAIKKKIDDAKKQRAAAKGVTGYESTLSTKRKVNDDSPEQWDGTPSKRARPFEAPTTPTPQPSTTTSKSNPPATSTSNLFAKAIGDKPAAPSQPNSFFTPQSTAKPAAKTTTAGFTPSTSTDTAAATAGFIPNFGSGAKATSSTTTSSGFAPISSGSASGGGGSFFSQFTKTAKTYEELAAERKKKAMDEDYDSDDETKEEWSARYDKKEAERLAEEKKKAAETPAFTIPASTKPSGNATPSSNVFTAPKSTSGAATPSLFTPRFGSPAPSTGGQSVFDDISAAQTPSSNPFAHLSSGPSSNNQEDSDDEDTEQRDEPIGSVESTSPPKRKFGDSETEEDGISQKKQKGSLLSRMTRFDETEASEKEATSTTSIFGQSNGAQTPNKPFQFFDFNAAGSKAGSPQPESFAGDNTFKPGTPIKFGDAPASEQKDAAPKFSFQPATPSAADFSATPAKPPVFNFGLSGSGASLLAPNAGFSGPGSVTSSVFSSRAGTPLSEAESGASAADDEDEGGNQEQVDLSKLTEEELESLDIIFHAEVTLAKQPVDKDGAKSWANIAKGPLWILKDKVTAKSFVRVRIASGATPLNYQILPSLQASVIGSSRKQVAATMPKKEGGLTPVYFALKNSEIAEEFATKYNRSLPSN